MQGQTFSQRHDGKRLGRQLDRVRDFLIRHRGRWFTLRYLSGELGYPEASVSARLRDLRKERFGEYPVERRRCAPGSGTWEYRLAPPREPVQETLWSA